MGINKLIEGFGNQSTLGIYICLLIVFVALAFVIISRILFKYYKNLYNELLTMRNKNEENFSSSVLIKIYNEFKGSLGKGTERVNTSAVISKSISKGIYLCEDLLNYSISTVIVLGLLGTFIGLTGAILQVEVLLKDLKDVNEFTNVLKGPLASMGTAFFTSIFGIVASLIMNIIAIFTYKGEKEKFFDEIEDYLDNHIYVKYSRNYNELLYVFTNKVEGSMKYMTDKVTETFDSGIDRFVERINGVSLDLTESAKALKEVIDELHINVQSFNVPVTTFKESVNEFKKYYEGFNFNMNEIAKVLNLVTNNLEVSQDKLNLLGNKIEIYAMKNEDMLTGRIKEVLELHNLLSISVDDLKYEIGKMSERVASALRESFKEETKRVGRELSSRMEKPIGDLIGMNNDNGESMLKISKSINTLEKIISRLEKSFTSKSFLSKISKKDRGDVNSNE